MNLLPFSDFDLKTPKILEALNNASRSLAELKGFVDSLEKFVISHERSDNKIDFLKKARNNKIASIIANMGICCATLGYFVPKIMFAYRNKQSGSKEFHVEKEIKEKLAQSFSSNTI